MSDKVLECRLRVKNEGPDLVKGDGWYNQRGGKKHSLWVEIVLEPLEQDPVFKKLQKAGVKLLSHNIIELNITALYEGSSEPAQSIRSDDALVRIISQTKKESTVLMGVNDWEIRVAYHITEVSSKHYGNRFVVRFSVDSPVRLRLSDGTDVELKIAPAYSRPVRVLSRKRRVESETKDSKHPKLEPSPKKVEDTCEETSPDTLAHKPPVQDMAVHYRAITSLHIVIEEGQFYCTLCGFFIEKEDNVEMYDQQYHSPCCPLPKVLSSQCSVSPDSEEYSSGIISPRNSKSEKYEISPMAKKKRITHHAKPDSFPIVAPFEDECSDSLHDSAGIFGILSMFETDFE